MSSVWIEGNTELGQVADFHFIGKSSEYPKIKYCSITFFWYCQKTNNDIESCY